MACFPFGGRHAVDDRAAGFLVHISSLGDPVAEAVAAKAGEPHQVDVCGVAAMLEQADEPAECDCGHSIVQAAQRIAGIRLIRSEEHTSELQSLMRSSYAVFCLKKKTKKHHNDVRYKSVLTN